MTETGGGQRGREASMEHATIDGDGDGARGLSYAATTEGSANRAADAHGEESGGFQAVSRSGHFFKIP